MGPLLHILMLLSPMALSVQSEPASRMRRVPGVYRSLQSNIDNCSLTFSTEVIGRISKLKADLEEGRFDAIVLHLQIYMNHTKNVSDIIWTMANPGGLFLSTNSKLVMTASLTNSTKIEHIQAKMTCDLEVSYGNNAIALDLLGAFLNVLGGSGTSGTSGQTCNGTANCTETCGTAVEETFLIDLTYYWVVVILLYSPNLIYLLYDALHIKEDNLTHYHKKDWPYSGKRFLLKLSYYMTTCCPLSQKHTKRRPVTRAVLILWVVSIIVQVFNACLQLSDLSSQLAYKEIDGWMYQSLSQITRYYIYGTVVVVGMIITLILLHTMSTGTFKQLLDDPDIFMLSSSKTVFVKKTKLKHFLKHEEMRELTEGHIMIAMHAERLMLLFNPRFWFLLMKESFSGLQFRKTSVFWNCILFVPVLLCSMLCLTLNAAVNTLWGLVPILGLFFSCLTLVNSWLELFRVCFIALYFIFFVIIICGNNLVFFFNILIYTTLHTIPCSSFDDLSKYFMVFPILLYLFFYCKKFTGGYRTMLEYMFKLKLEADTDKENEQQPVRQTHRGSTASDESLAKPEVTQKVSIKEFDFVCSECSPVRKKVLNILIKTMMTGIFMLLTLTVLFLRREIDSFSKAAKAIGFVVIVLLPRIIEKFWSSDEAIQKEELEEKISAAVCRWKCDKRVYEKDIYPIEVDGVNCNWWNSCTNTKHREASQRNKPEQAYDLKEGSLSMLNTTAVEQTV